MTEIYEGFSAPFEAELVFNILCQFNIVFRFCVYIFIFLLSLSSPCGLPRTSFVLCVVVAGSGAGIDCTGGSHCLFTVRKFFKNAIRVKHYSCSYS
jgi:hypothetical protein